MHSVHRVKLFMFSWISETATLPFAVLIDSFFFCNRDGKVFTVRYELAAYIKQITFRP